MNQSAVDILTLLAVFCWAFTICCVFVTLSHIYMGYRIKKIYQFVNTTEIELDLEKITNAQKRFWVWPIERAFK